MKCLPHSVGVDSGRKERACNSLGPLAILSTLEGEEGGGGSHKSRLKGVTSPLLLLFATIAIEIPMFAQSLCDLYFFFF